FDAKPGPESGHYALCLVLLNALQTLFLRITARIGSSIRKSSPFRVLIRPRCDRRASLHLYDLFADGKPEARSTLGFGVGAVDLVELLENPCLVVLWDAGPGISHTDAEMAGHRPRRTRTSPTSVHLLALPTRLRRTCVRRCSSPTPMGSGLATTVLRASF